MALTTCAARSTYDQFCAQLDDCNVLEVMSVDECVAWFEEDCGGALHESEAEDLEESADECLDDFDTCAVFHKCYLYEVPYC